MIIKFKVDGMSCNHCSSNIKNRFLEIDSVETAEVDLATKEVTLKGSVEKELIEEIINDLGFDYLG